jgi:uroporphyrinogen-III synthase
VKRVLVTGPLESSADYADAARRAGWEAFEWPLLRIVPHRHDVAALLAQRFDWICVTSSSALAFLGDLCRAGSTLRSVPCAIVGERSGRRARELGFAIDLVAASAAELCDELARRAPGGARVLWPRGHLSDELADELRRCSFSVDDPVVYATLQLERSSAPPATDAIFFASPSAVRAWYDRAPSSTMRARHRSEPEHESERRGDMARTGDRGAAAARIDEPRVAIAIGSTTLDALMSETELSFFDTISLPEPTPEAFGFVLAHLDPPREPTFEAGDAERTP